MDILLNLFIANFEQVFCTVDKIKSVFTRSRSTMETPEQFVKSVPSLQQRHHWRRSGVFIINFEKILHIALVFSLWTLNE